MRTEIPTSEFAVLYRLFTRFQTQHSGTPLPLPEEVRGVLNGDAEASEESMAWLEVFDLAALPKIFHEGMVRNDDPATSSTVIRYLAGKPRHAETDMERLDWLLTHTFQKMAARRLPVRERLIREMIEGWLHATGGARMSREAKAHLDDLATLREEVVRQAPAGLDVRRVEERAMAIKRQLGDEYFDSAVLAVVVEFNMLLAGAAERQEAASPRAARRERPVPVNAQSVALFEAAMGGSDSDDIHETLAALAASRANEFAILADTARERGGFENLIAK